MKILLATTPSDSHTWNLVYLKLLLEELNCDVNVLGACTPIKMIVDNINSLEYDLVVISTVNGHGFLEAEDIAMGIINNCHLAVPPIIIGGKLVTNDALSLEQKNRLIKAGYTKVYTSKNSIDELLHYLKLLKGCKKGRA